jgi:hypothetical protein
VTALVKIMGPLLDAIRRDLARPHPFAHERVGFLRAGAATMPGGLLLTGFSGIDLSSADEFVPGFFETAPRMPHGLLVLSDDSVTGLLWFDPRRPAKDISGFARIGAPLRSDWEAS